MSRLTRERPKNKLRIHWYAHGVTAIIDRDSRPRFSQLVSQFFGKIKKQRWIDGTAVILTLLHFATVPARSPTDNLWSALKLEMKHGLIYWNLLIFNRLLGHKHKFANYPRIFLLMFTIHSANVVSMFLWLISATPLSFRLTRLPSSLHRLFSKYPRNCRWNNNCCLVNLQSS